MQDRFPMGILHAVAPYSDDPECELLLQSCYMRCMELARTRAEIEREPGFQIATALLGTGVKGVAPDIAAEALCAVIAGPGSDVQTTITWEVVVQEQEGFRAIEKALDSHAHMDCLAGSLLAQ